MKTQFPYSIILVMLWALVANHTFASPTNIQVVALYKHTAMINVDGKQRLLHVGERSPEGILLIEASSKEVLIEVNGERKKMALSADGAHYVAENPKKPAASEPVRAFSVSADANGMYHVKGKINGEPVTFLFDTGASAVALPRDKADALHLKYKRGIPIVVTTASGQVPGYLIKIDEITLGDTIELHDVPATVIDAPSTAKSEILLGMSAVRALHIENHGNEMLIQQNP